MTEMNLMPLGEQEYNELLLQAVAIRFRGTSVKMASNWLERGMELGML